MTYQLRTLSTRQMNPNFAQWLNFGGHPTRTTPGQKSDGNPSSNKRAPSYDLRQTPTQIEIKLAMPGVSPETLDVSIERRRLTISGQSKQDVPDPASQLLHEGLGEGLGDGHFEQVFDLTEDADPDAIRASIKFGLVTILIPRKTDQLPRRIAVEH